MLPSLTKDRSVFDRILAAVAAQENERSGGIESLEPTVVVAANPAQCDRCR
jgi:hypothetical protein